MDDIHSTFDELQKTLNVRKSVLLMELEVNYGLKHKVRLRPGRTSTGGLVPGLHQQQSGLKRVLGCHCCLVKSSFYLTAYFSLFPAMFSFLFSPKLGFCGLKYHFIT